MENNNKMNVNVEEPGTDALENSNKVIRLDDYHKLSVMEYKSIMEAARKIDDSTRNYLHILVALRKLEVLYNEEFVVKWLAQVLRGLSVELGIDFQNWGHVSNIQKSYLVQPDKFVAVLRRTPSKEVYDLCDAIVTLHEREKLIEEYRKQELSNKLMDFNDKVKQLVLRMKLDEFSDDEMIDMKKFGLSVSISF